jgi:hypothetical protein
MELAIKRARYDLTESITIQVSTCTTLINHSTGCIWKTRHLCTIHANGMNPAFHCGYNYGIFLFIVEFSYRSIAVNRRAHIILEDSFAVYIEGANQPTSSYINDFKTVNAPYEGHYLHTGTSVNKRKQEIQFYKGAILIPTNQPTAKYIVNVLSAPFSDSFFNWNYFDGILQQKEYFAPYVFDETAAKIVRRDPALQKKLKQQRAETPGFATSSYPQLLYIYRNSNYYEKEHNRLPVFEID